MSAATAPLALGRLGLGAVTFGREIDARTAGAIMERAWSAGIRSFDTAASYGAGASETIVGRWLAARPQCRAAAIVATKIRPPYVAATLGDAVDASRRRLGLARLPLLYLHAWDDSACDARFLAALDALVRAGVVGAVGASNVSTHQRRRLLAVQERHGLAPVASVQNNHNFAVREVDAPLRALCAQRRIAIVTYSALGAGFLTGKHRDGVAPGSRFALVPGHPRVYFNARARARLACLEAFAQRHARTPAQLSLAWALAEPGIACTLVGARSVAHLEQALAAPREIGSRLLAALRRARPRAA